MSLNQLKAFLGRMQDHPALLQGVQATVLSLGVVPPFYVAIKQLEARWFPEPQQEPAG